MDLVGVVVTGPGVGCLGDLGSVTGDTGLNTDLDTDLDVSSTTRDLEVSNDGVMVVVEENRVP